MRFSVITVTFNCADTIERTIASVLSQQAVEVEYIIFDGCSSDGTVEIIKNYANQLSCFISEPDDGIYYAMNKGLLHATGDIVYFLNGDDFLYDEKTLSVIEERFRENDLTEVVIAKELISGRVCETFDLKKNKSVYIDAFFPHQATFVRRDLYERLGFFDLQYRICADYDWILKAISKGAHVVWTDDVVAVYDPYGTSSSIKGIKEQYIISMKYLNELKRIDLIEFAQSYYSNMFRIVFFRGLIKQKRRDDMIAEAIRSVLHNDVIAVYGAGYIGKLLCDFLRENGIAVSCIYDSNVSNCDYNGIPIVKYSGEKKHFMIVASENYDAEICKMFFSKGLREEVEFLSYYEFSKRMVMFLLKNNYDDGFQEMTGLNVLECMTR